MKRDMIKVKIATIIAEHFERIYCDNCGHYIDTEDGEGPGCDWCKKDALGWTVSEWDCVVLADLIMMVVEKYKQEV